MEKRLFGNLIVLALFAAFCASAHAQLTINANFTAGDTTNFPGSSPISSVANASTVEATIDAAIAQITSLIKNPLSFNIDFVSDPSISLGESVGAGSIDIPYSTFRSDLQSESNLSADQTIALAHLPAGPGTGINNNATQLSVGAANLDALGDTTDGNSIIASNNGFAGTIALNMTQMNISRSPYDNSKYDLVSTVTHEVDEILGIGGQGSTLGQSGTDIGIMDLYRFSAAESRSYTTSSNAVSYFSINGGTTDLVHFNQSPDGDYGDWGDGFTPADGQGNNPAQVQDAFGGTDAEPNMGPNEAIALNVDGWDLTAAGIALESVPEPGTYLSMLLGGLMLIGIQRFRRRRS